MTNHDLVLICRRCQVLTTHFTRRIDYSTQNIEHQKHFRKAKDEIEKRAKRPVLIGQNVE